MPIKFGEQKEQDGIFIQECTILEIQDCTSQPSPFPGDTTNPDLYLKVRYDCGQSFTPELTLTGMFQRDEQTKAITGLPYKLDNFFTAIGVTGTLEDDYHIPSDTLQMCYGRKFLRVSYLAGFNTEKNKNIWKNWWKIGSVDRGAESLKKAFLQDVARGKVTGYGTPSTTP